MNHKKLNKYLKAASDMTRMKVLLMLNKSPMAVKDIIKKLKIEPSLLSHHLEVLRKIKMVTAKRNGKSVTYSRNDSTFQTYWNSIVKVF